MTLSNISIAVKNVDSWYGEKQVLKNINMEIEKKSITALIGPSACGKTTFLKSLNRINDLVKGFKISGIISVGGQDIYKDIKKASDLMFLRQKMGMVFQIPNPFPMSIYKNLALPFSEKNNLSSRKRIDEVVVKCLKDVHLYDEVKERLDASALDLSGGQQQRLCIARCLTITPEIILFDEPCSSLDPISTLKIEDLLRELKEQYTLVIVTHNLEQAKRIADRVGFFYQGELIEYSAKDKFFTRPRHELTQKYLAGKF
jgi:phosphate transport system ATP-binding protein